MTTYEVILKNNKKTTVTEYIINDIKNAEYIKSIKPINKQYGDTNTLVDAILSHSEIISKNNTIFYCKFTRPCDTIFFELYKYSDNEWSPNVKFTIDRKNCNPNFLKSFMDINKFYELFFLEIDLYKQSKIEVLSTIEMEKVRKICFYNKDGIKAFFDNFGNIYYCYKAMIPTKKSKARYKELNNSADSVLIYYADGLRYCHQYFKNIDEAKQYMNNNNISTWYVDKYGFTGVDPEKKKIYHRLPYYNILHELSIGEEINKIAWRWSKASNSEDFGTLLILAKAYLAFKRNDELARIQILSEQ